MTMHDIFGMSECENSNLHLVQVAKTIFNAAVKRVSAPKLLGGIHKLPISDFCRVIGAGKASMTMAGALEQSFPDCTFEGQVVVPYDYSASFPEGQSPPKVIMVEEGGHPIPDIGSQRAARTALKIAKTCGHGETLIVLLSGGASALWSLPATSLTLQDLRTVNQLLIQSGAEIRQINTIRKHLSSIKGGQLAKAAWSAHIVTLAISDVVGDDESVIGSGPTVGDPTTWQDTMDIIQSLDLQVPDTVLEHINRGISGVQPDTPKPGSEQLKRSYFQLLASNADALKTAEETARKMGYDVVAVERNIHGEAREVGMNMARHTLKLRPGQCLIWGGETTVTVRGCGKGGRNQELVLAASCEFDGEPVDAALLSGGTDGIDGPTDAAGGWATPSTAAAMRSQGIDPYAALEVNDAYHCLRAVKHLLVTGPTHTNVMDIGIGLVAHE